MTMLTRTGGLFEPARYSPDRRTMAETATANAHLPIINRFRMGAVAVLTAGVGVAAIIALKAVFYFSHFNY